MKRLLSDKVNRSIAVIIFLGICIVLLFLSRIYITQYLESQDVQYYSKILDYISDLRLFIALTVVGYSLWFAFQVKKSTEIQLQLSQELMEHNDNLQVKIKESTIEIEQHAEELQAKSDDMQEIMVQMEVEIENRKRLEEEANTQRQLTEEKMLFEKGLSTLNKLLQDENDIANISDHALANIVDFLGAQTGSIYLLEGTKIIRKAGYAYSGDANQIITLGEGTVGEVAKSGKAMLTTVPESLGDLKFGCLDLQLAQVVDFPLIYKEEILGVIEIGLLSKLSDMQLEWLKKGAEILSTSLKVANDNFELNQVMEKVSINEERFRQILESSGEGLFGMDIDGVITFINPIACEILGYTQDELLGERAHDKFHAKLPDGKAYPLEECHMRAASRDGKVARIDDEVLWSKGGEAIQVEYTATPIWESGKIVGSVVSR